MILFRIFILCFLWQAVFAKEVLINVDAENPPFMFDGGGKAAGLYPDLLRAAFKKMGLEATIEPKPWTRALSEIDAGRAGVGGIYKNEARLKKYDYSEPLFVENISVYITKNGKDFKFNSAEDLIGRHVGVIRGWSYGDQFDALKKAEQIKAEEVGADSQNFEKLENNRLDAVLAVEDSGKVLLASGKYKNIIAAPKYLLSNPAHLAFAKTAQQSELLLHFNQTIGQMKADGSFEEIKKQHLGK